MKNTFILILLILNIFNGQSQSNGFSYSPSNKDSLIGYLKKISANKIIKLGDKNKKEIKKLIEERRDDFLKTIEDSTYIFDKNIHLYLKSILSEIYSKNKINGVDDFYFFINKSPIPNAACYGNGVFTVNLGLFNTLDNDDELAFVLSHEIAHYILEHTDKNILNYLETLNSKDIKSKIKKLNNQEYGKRKAYSELLKELNYNFLNRSRKSEIQADSLGQVLFNKTKYNKNSSITALEKLDKSDDLLFNEDAKLKEKFDFESYPFKEEWLIKDETLFNLKESSNDYVLNKDSLKTHPDIPFRIDLIKKLLPKKLSENGISSNLNYIKKVVSSNMITTSMDDSKLDLVLYQTLVLYNKNEIDKKNFVLTVANILKKTYETKLNHSFGKYVESPSPFSDEKYLNEVKNFLLNIELKNIRKIGYFFCQKHKNLMTEDKDFTKLESFFSKLNN
ncbi:MAG: M48 family metallopeptidase [Limnohabitans sp.]|nr:M48 family metallopeptidase [Limnohabitans sp.]